MRIFGLQITKAPPPQLSPVFGQSGGWSTIFDSTPQGHERDRPPGAFQQNAHFRGERLVSFSPVYSCITLIANDIGKLKQCLRDTDQNGILTDASSAAFSPVLAKPNSYQNHIQFKQWWIMSKLDAGNAYALKERDNRGVVIGLYILDPRRCHPLVALDGSVYYQLGEDNLSGVLDAQITVPASEIIHDRMNCLFHPLVGISPLYAAALVAEQGLDIQRDSLKFFKNGSAPSGVLTAPGQISEPTAKRAKDYWDAHFAGRSNSGKVAVLGDGLKFEPMRMTSVDAQVTEQLLMSSKFICSVYHVPPFKVGLEEIPRGQKVTDLNQVYYDDCLQSLIEEYELCLGEGLGLPSVAGHDYVVQLDIDGLLRMDQASMFTMLGDGVKNSVLTPNEARARVNLGPIKGGDTVYMQQQNYSLSALDARDEASPAPSSTTPAPTASPGPELDSDGQPVDDPTKDFAIEITRTVDEFGARVDKAIEAMNASAQADAEERARKQAEADAFEQAHAFAEALIARFAEPSDAT